MIYMLTLKHLLIETYYTFVYYIPGIFREITSWKNSKEALPIISFLDVKWGRFHRNNWGDDMNVFLCREWFHKNIICYNISVLSWLLDRTNYCMIGSILQSANKSSIVWGSGLLFEREYPKEQPKKIYAVRGPLSRKVLIEHGISCPEVYGDPILLISKYYQPKVKKQFKLGIIPHMNDEGNSDLDVFIANHPETCLISMKHYSDWHEVIDKINSCETILSSSLHGLILSDAYGIPNAWIEFKYQAENKKFKFLDYFSAVKRKDSEPVIIHSASDFNIAKRSLSTYEGIDINLQPLIDSCPFSLPF